MATLSVGGLQKPHPLLLRGKKAIWNYFSKNEPTNLMLLGISAEKTAPPKVPLYSHNQIAQRQKSFLLHDKHQVRSKANTFQETPPVMAEVELDEAGEPLARQLDQV